MLRREFMVSAATALTWGLLTSRSAIAAATASSASVPALNAADKALYAAKAGGRNQSVVASLPKLSLVA